MIAAYLPKEACNINNIQYPIIYNIQLYTITFINHCRGENLAKYLVGQRVHRPESIPTAIICILTISSTLTI